MDATKQKTLLYQKKTLSKILEKLAQYEQMFKADGIEEAEELDKIQSLKTTAKEALQKIQTILQEDISNSEDNDDLADILQRLLTLKALKYTLNSYYYGNLKKGYNENKPVEENYKRVFEEDKVTKTDAEVFIKAYDDGSFKKNVTNKYGEHEDADNLRVFLKENGDAACVEILKADAKACIERYRLVDELEALIELIEEGTTLYNSILNSNETISNADAATINEWKQSLENFTSSYAALNDKVLQDHFQETNESHLKNLEELPDIEQFIELKKRANKIEDGITYFNDVVCPNRAALLTTNEEIDKVKQWKIDIENYINY